MKNIVWLFVGFGLAYYLILQKYGSLTTALAAWQPTVATVVSTSQPAIASGGQGTGSLAPESSFYAASLPNAYNPLPVASGNNAASVGAQHVNPVNSLARPVLRVTGITPVAKGIQLATTYHAQAPAKTFVHPTMGAIGTA